MTKREEVRVAALDLAIKATARGQHWPPVDSLIRIATLLEGYITGEDRPTDGK